MQASCIFITKRERERIEKTLGALAGITLLVLSGSSFANEELKHGQKIYERAFGRGCGACHDISSNPQLPALIKSGDLSKDSFIETLKNGKNGMPKAMAAIMGIKYVQKKGLTEEEAVDALYKFLSK